MLDLLLGPHYLRVDLHGLLGPGLGGPASGGPLSLTPLACCRRLAPLWFLHEEGWCLLAHEELGPGAALPGPKAQAQHTLVPPEEQAAKRR